jgi:hypothetical protein
MSIDNLIPQSSAQWLATVLAAILAAMAGWFARRKREPVELDKLRAETRQIHITAENAQVGVGLETYRELQSVIQRAEQRREEWLLKEEQMRNQIGFWRNKSEELDGELVDSRDANAQLQIRYKLKHNQLDKAMALLKYHNISYDELDEPKE